MPWCHFAVEDQLLRSKLCINNHTIYHLKYMEEFHSGVMYLAFKKYAWYSKYRQFLIHVIPVVNPTCISLQNLRTCTYALYNGLLTRYVKLRVVHAPGMPGTFSPPPTSKETASWRSRHASRHMRHARAVIHVGIMPCIPSACETRTFTYLIRDAMRCV